MNYYNQEMSETMTEALEFHLEAGFLARSCGPKVAKIPPPGTEIFFHNSPFIRHNYSATFCGRRYPPGYRPEFSYRRVALGSGRARQTDKAVLSFAAQTG